MIYLPKGRHKLRFITDDNERIIQEIFYEVKDVTISDFIDVKFDESPNAPHSCIKENVLSNDISKEIKLQDRDKTKEAKIEDENKEFEVGNVSFKMIYVRGGIFTMGDTEEGFIHNVKVSDYLCGETPVTQALWQAVMNKYRTPSTHLGLNCPVDSVSWENCQNFLNALNQKTGKRFRLLTEAEWEFASRGGNKTKGYKYAGSNNISEVAWFSNNSEERTHEVKSKKANELGIYDMSGNIEEWCQDRYEAYETFDQTNLKVASYSKLRTLRGGSYRLPEEVCRITCRGYAKVDKKRSDIGFRLALSVE